MTYRKNSFEAAAHAMLTAAFPQPDARVSLIFHELWRDAEGWSVNDSWRAYRNVDLPEAIEHLRGRWEVFKINYAPKARVRDIVDDSMEEGECRLECAMLSFATVEAAAA